MADKEHELTVPATAEALSQVRRHFQPIFEATAPGHADMLVLLVDECCSNVVKHRSEAISDGHIHLRVAVNAARVRIELQSYCLADQVSDIKPRHLADVRPGGLGTHFIGSIADRVDYVPSGNHPGSMTLVLEKDI